MYGVVEGACGAVRPVTTVGIRSGILRAVLRRDEHDVADVAWPHDGDESAKLLRVSNRGVPAHRWGERMRVCYAQTFV